MRPLCVGVHQGSVSGGFQTKNTVFSDTTNRGKVWAAAAPWTRPVFTCCGTRKRRDRGGVGGDRAPVLAGPVPRRGRPLQGPAGPARRPSALRGRRAPLGGSSAPGRAARPGLEPRAPVGASLVPVVPPQAAALQARDAWCWLAEPGAPGSPQAPRWAGSRSAPEGWVCPPW